MDFDHPDHIGTPVIVRAAKVSTLYIECYNETHGLEWGMLATDRDSSRGRRIMAHQLVRKLLRSVPLWIALGISFFGSLAWAAAFFPHAYDWRHDVISSLASPRDNPHAYVIACAGLAISGLLLIPFSFFLSHRLEPVAPRLTSAAGVLFRAGALCLFLSALVVPGHYRILGIGRTHEHLAQISGVTLGLSLLLYCGAILRLPPLLPSVRAGAALGVILPVTALAISRLTLFLAYEFAAPAVYRAVRSSLWSSLALWEWIGAVCIYFFLGLMTWEAAMAQNRPGG